MLQIYINHLLNTLLGHICDSLQQTGFRCLFR